MASKFTDFLLKLSDDPQLLEKYKGNPVDVMIAEGLTPAERALLLSGNVQLIRSAIVNDPGYKEAMGISPEQTLSAVIIVIPIVHGAIPDSSKS